MSSNKKKNSNKKLPLKKNVIPSKEIFQEAESIFSCNQETVSTSAATTPKKSLDTDYPGTPPKKRLVTYQPSTPVTPNSPHASSTEDYSGFIHGLWHAKSKNGNPYIDIKMKVDVDQYLNVRIMKSQNPSLDENRLKALQTGQVPIKLVKVFTTSTGTQFFNTFRGSQIIEGVTVPFRSEENIVLSIKDIKLKESGTYSVKGCFKWFGDTKTVMTKAGTEKRLRECILYDGTGDIILACWENVLDNSLKESNQWYQFTNVNVKNFFGIKLTTTSCTEVTECADEEDLDWQKVDIDFHTKHDEETSTIISKKLVSPSIQNIEVDIYNSCSNLTCNKKVTLVPGAKIIRCNCCGRLMRPDACRKSFEAYLEFESVRLTLPLEVIEDFLEEDILETYTDNIECLVEKLLYLQDVCYSYNSRNHITCMERI